MTFSQGGRFEGGRVQSRRGRRGAAAGGGIGIGVIALFLLSQITGVDLTGLAGGGGGGGGTETVGVVEDCTAEQANTDPACRLSGAAQSLDAYWARVLPEQAGVEYVVPSVVEFTDAVQTRCGDATAAVGPFYCPPDQSVYLDLAFYDTLRAHFGTSGGPLAQMYIVAHEFGHHIEQLIGAMDQADRGGTGPESDSVRIELMADCLAGMWVGEAATVVDPDTGVPFLEPISEQELADALSAAAAVGDDRIQEQATGTVNPEAWTHGSAEQRQRWFTIGYNGGTVADCNALGAPSL